MVSNEVAVRRVSRAAQELRGGGREGHWVLRAAERPTPHEVRHLGETGKNLVLRDAAFAVRREVVLPLQGRGLGKKSDKQAIANGSLPLGRRDLSEFLGNWSALARLAKS